MGTEIIRRTKQPVLITRAIRRRANPSFFENVRTYAPVWGFFVWALGLLGLSITIEATMPGTQWYAIVGICLSILVGAAHMIWWAEMSEDHALTIDKRREQIMLDRQRRYRAHRDLEVTYPKDVANKFPRYSVDVARDGSGIKFTIVSHEKQHRCPWIRWKAAKTKKRVQDGSFSSAPLYAGTLSSPNLEAISEAMIAYEEVAKQLEKKALDEALSEHAIDIMALVAKRPALSAKDIPDISRFDPKMRDVLAEYERLRAIDP